LFDQPARIRAVDFASHGLGDGHTFAFWPMLIGGLFLYLSYYGCDQTQAQRELSTRSVDDTNRALFLDGMLRFPLVLSYCFLGLCLSAYALMHPEFVSGLPVTEIGEPNYNLAVPVFVLKHFPHGLIGLVMVGLFAAAMSSLDSTLNALSALNRIFDKRTSAGCFSNGDADPAGKRAGSHVGIDRRIYGESFFVEIRTQNFLAVVECDWLFCGFRDGISDQPRIPQTGSR
jgi:hypothetical protein